MSIVGSRVSTLFFLCLSLFTQAQPSEYVSSLSDSKASSYTFDFVLLQDGNSTGYINSVIETADGMLWMAGDNGLFLNDGKELHIYNNTSDRTFLDIDNITNIHKLNDDYFILVGHDQIHWFNVHTRKIDNSVSYPIHVIPAVENIVQIADVTITEDETIWLLSPHKQDSMYLAKIDREGVASYVDKIGSLYFTKLISDGNSVIVGRNHGINIYDSISDNIVKYDIKPNNKVFVPYSILKDDKNTIWLKGDCEFENSYLKESNNWIENDCSIYLLKDGQNEFKKYNQINDRELGETFFLKKDGADFWIGGDHLQLKRFNTKSKTSTDYTPQLLSSFKDLKRSPFFSQIINYYKDSGGSLWISTSAGLIKGTINPQSLFQIHLRSDADFCQSICVMHGITEDDNGDIYVAYNNDVAKINSRSKEIEYINKLPESSDIATSYSVIYNDNKLYWNDLVYDLAKRTSTYLSDNPGTDEIANYLDDQNLLWIETKINDSLQVIQHNIQTKESNTLKIGGDFHQALHVNQFLESKRNTTWIATLNGGIYEVNTEGIIVNHFDTTAHSTIQLNDPYVAYMYEDDQGHLWIGNKKGLSKLDLKQNTIQHYKDQYKLYRGAVVNREVYSILPAGEEHFLLGTNKGLSKFSIKTGEYKILNGLATLQDEEYNRLSAYQSADGKYYFGSVNGLFSFYLEDIDPYFSSGTLHDISISNISVFNQSSKQTRTINRKQDDDIVQLKHDDQNLEINYVLPDNIMGPEILYSYRMTGLSDKWSLPSNQNTIRFDFLPAGEYNLEVKAGYEVNKLDYSTLTQKIVIAQAWYKTWWFLSLCILAGAALIYALVSNHYKQQAEKQSALSALRTKISSDLHDDVGSTLSGLSMQAQVLGHQAEGEQKDQLQQISNMSIHAMDTMRDTVWAIDSRQDKYANLIDRMRDFAEKSLHKSNIEFTFSSTGINLDETMLPNIRQQLYLIFKEAIANGIKHSKADHIIAQLEKNNNKLQLTISDNGIGSTNINKSGLGLKNIKMRTKKIGGQLKISHMNGFQVEVSVPV